jgi:hypothetical protein
MKQIIITASVWDALERRQPFLLRHVYGMKAVGEQLFIRGFSISIYYFILIVPS